MMKTLLITGVLVAAAAQPVLAQSGGRSGPDRLPSFAELDANGDGQVTQEELAALRAARFAEIDTNGDGTVSREEFVARAQAQSAERAERMFDRLDADGDGSLSRDALEARRGRGPDPARIFGRLDTDDDGAVSEAEFDAGMERLAEMRAKRGGDRGPFGKNRN